MTHKVFVYGTLKQGRGNHIYVGNGRLLKSALTKDDYVLTTCGFPFMIPEETSTGTFEALPVMGEVYEVNDDDLANMDSLEGEGHFYHRRNINVEGFEEGEVQAYLMLDSREEMGNPLCPVKEEGDTRYYEF